ncbi:NAD(P)H-dependent oxidoreductase [Breoghania sp.]|uniref:NAD(P)H-dependent oxidoreductase n=1 Tax=Breoghania sp. TaxID=2065378 RepID=UPI002AAACCD8|nr:NAD(P)H-dependent oxidoreductase [Breoghania sp.]
MARTITVIHGHPDRAGTHLCQALGDAYVKAAQAAGHNVREITIGDLDFPILRNEAEFSGPVPDSLAESYAALREAEHIVILFPLWLGTLPALTKAFFEQVFHRDTAFEDNDGGFPHGRFKGRTARLVVTMGMPAFFYRLWYRAHGLKGFERNVLAMVGMKPLKAILFGGAGTADEATRKGWLEKMEELGREGI